LASQKEFVRTVEKPQPSADGDYGVYALDCEMCYSTGGGEPARIAVISSHGKTVYVSRYVSNFRYQQHLFGQWSPIRKAAATI
jgi:hypothetical protein